MTELNEHLKALEQLTNIKTQNRARSNKYYMNNKLKLKERRQTKQREKEEEKERLFNIDEYLNIIKLNYGELSKIYILVYLILNYGIYEHLYIFDENKTIDNEAQEKNKEANFLIIPENKNYNCYVIYKNKLINEYGGQDIKLLNNYVSDLIQRYKEQYNINFYQFLFTNNKFLKEHVKRSNELLNIDMTLNNLLNIYKTNKLNKQLEAIKHIKANLPENYNYNVELIKPEEGETIILKVKPNIIYDVSEFRNNLKEAMKKDKLKTSKINKEFINKLNQQQTNN